MRKLVAAIGFLLALLVLASAAAADPRIGINDDAGKYGNGDPRFFETMASLGLSENVMTVLWDPSHPTDIAEQALLERALPVAAANGVDVVLDVYPASSRGATSGRTSAPSTSTGSTRRSGTGSTAPRNRPLPSGRRPESRR